MEGKNTSQPLPPPIASTEAPHMVSSVKLPILKKGEYILWTMKMEQYLAHTDYALLEVILNANSAVQRTKDEVGNKVEVPPVTAQQILARTRERKAKRTLLMTILDEHLARFHGIKDAKTLWAAIKTRFGGNAESKKMQKNVLKQQFEIFSVSNPEGLDKGYDRFQRLLILLEIHRACVSTKDANQKFLRYLPLAWSNISLIMRNKPGIDNLDIDDLYNNLKFYEADIKGSFGSSSNLQNMDFVFAKSTSSTNKLNAAYSVYTAATRHNSQAQGSSSYIDELMFLFFTNQSSSPQLNNEDLEQIDQDDLEEMDLKWQVAMLSMRVKRFYKKTGRKLEFNGKEQFGFDKTKRKNNGTRPTKEEDENALVVQDGLGIYVWSYQVEEEATGFALMAFTSNPSSSSSLNSEVQSCSKQYVQSYEQLENLFDEQREKLRKANLEIIEEQVTETVFDNRSSDEENSLANDRFKKGKGYHAVPPSLTGNYMPSKSDLSFARLDDSIYKFKISKTVTSVTKDENYAPKPSTACHGKMTPKIGLGFGFTKKACFVCGSMSHLIKDCIFHEDRMAKKSVLPNNVGKGTGHTKNKPVWNNVQRTNHQNKFAPTAIFTRFRRIPVSGTKPKVAASTSAAKPVNTAGPKQISVVKGNRVTPVKTSAGCVWRPRVNNIDQISKNNRWICTRVDYGHLQQALNNKGILDSGCSRHMTGNQAYLTDYQEINDGGFVAFGLSRGKITDKVLLRIPRQSNMYSFDLQNIVPSEDITCLFAKASINESNLWYRRLGHVNFKTMNKLVKGNLVRGLPSKIFENDHTCVACQKGKQYKSTCKAKLMSLISQPLQILHMDLFGPTSVMSINHKKYCLVVTDDFSKFSWVFFLASKDETSKVLKPFITAIENQINKKVKVIRCDNGTEFKNRDLDEFCRMKGIKREYSNAITLQQNGVAERKNMTLIEAARTMLANSLLPITFWAEVVNTACYVLNRALVTKSHNKTPYELLNGRTPRLDFMRPFGCLVTILNTLDPLEKFEGKADERFLVGCSVTSKAFRVFNTKNRKVEENLKEVSDQHNIVLPLWSCISSTFKSSDDKVADDKPKDDTGSKTVEEPVNKEDQAYRDELDRLMSQEKEASDAADALRKDNPVNDASTSGTFSAGGPSSPHPDLFIPANTLLHVDQDDSQIPDLKDTAELRRTGIFTSAYGDDFEIFTSLVQSVDAEADFNNIDSSTVISPIPTHRVHIDHPKNQILGDPKLAMRTRGMAKKTSGMEPKKVAQALDDESWVEAMQEELLQFSLQKKDKRGIVVRNKANLVAQGNRQEEGIDYDEVFTLVARIEAIRIFLAFASFMGFIVYQIYVKSAFLYGTIEEEVYVSQPPGFIDPQFLNKVYKVEKALYGLHQAPRASSRPDIMFAVCACSRFQVTTKLSHLHVVKRIFRKSTIEGCQFLGRRLILWQSKKQTIVATFTTEVEYVAAANCCG
uniref:Integrase catalytic domain-containing protein n=1 Tax=Tanacetum cinerariifolium TaxID=118510 RepID=A0A6L2K6X6_TANCI|nr:hypothetical protein [Tanacetum cinerariifolium]